MKFLEKAYSYRFEGVKNEVYQFRFISEGAQQITKIVTIAPVGTNIDWYNVGFGNLENEGDEIIVNDFSEVNNQDYDEVLATVFGCILHFLYFNPDSVILFFGNTLHKHRLYKQKISFNIESLEQYLDISGGKIEEKIVVIEKEQTVVRKGKEHKRMIREKDITSLSNGVTVSTIEKYNKDKTSDYQFVLFKLKSE